MMNMVARNEFASRLRTAMYSFSASSDLVEEYSLGSIKHRELVRRRILNATYHSKSLGSIAAIENGNSSKLYTSLLPPSPLWGV